MTDIPAVDPKDIGIEQLQARIEALEEELALSEAARKLAIKLGEQIDKDIEALWSRCRSRPRRRGEGMPEMTPEEAKQVGGSPMFAAMRELSDGGTYKRLDAYFMAAHWWEIWDALSVCLARIEALERAEDEWKQATEYLLEHYPEDVFPAGSNTPDAKAGTFARRLLTWLLDPVERARLAAEENT